ncbi:hypothetical protein PG985_003192 [Apiospora marii]|uniref:Uncharacterized protein n=1 Tax=Apiospora marii TaxID=335849 RepID=A0ABR1RV21_9PEZI
MPKSNEPEKVNLVPASDWYQSPAGNQKGRYHIPVTQNQHVSNPTKGMNSTPSPRSVLKKPTPQHKGVKGKGSKGKGFKGKGSKGTPGSGRSSAGGVPKHVHFD